MERWRDSELTAKEFAAEIGVNASTLTYWKWKLSRGGSARAIARTRTPRSEVAQPTFVELVAPRAESCDTRLELAVGGRVVKIPTGFDEETLRRLLAVMDGRT
ncbi:MAG: hypothetical protein AB7K71_19895 [Polyangiaceae bacterium]